MLFTLIVIRPLEIVGLACLVSFCIDIVEIPGGIFDKFNNLSMLNLYNNRLVKIPGGVFDKLLNLKHLDLSNNEIVLELELNLFDNLNRFGGIIYTWKQSF